MSSSAPDLYLPGCPVSLVRRYLDAAILGEPLPHPLTHEHAELLMAVSQVTQNRTMQADLALALMRSLMKRLAADVVIARAMHSGGIQ